MATIDPAALKANVELVLHDAEDVLPLLEGLPAPAGPFFVKALAVLKDVDAFLNT
jgi:hypothetical protein